MRLNLEQRRDMASSYTMVYVPVGNRHKGFSKPTISVGYCTPKRCLVAIAVSMVIGTVIIQLLLSFRHYLRDIHLRTDKDGELVIISKKIASKHNAVCLDGSSVPGYYMKEGIDEGEQKWLIMIPHSDWCNSMEDCRSSITSPLKGTMKKAPVTLQFTDILSSDPAENAYFADWNMIRLVPCSGSSYLGNGSVPQSDNYNKELRLNGAAVLAATLEHIISTTDISKSKQVVLYGEGSGAISALAYTNYIKSTLFVPNFTTLLSSGLLFDTRKSHFNVDKFFQLHNIKGNTVLRNCDSLSCLNAEQLLRSPRTSPVVVYTVGVPLWPLTTMYGCQNETDCTAKGYREKYFKAVTGLHTQHLQIRKLITILSHCDWSLKTTVTKEDPRIVNRSIYEILVESLSGNVKTAIYIDNGDCKGKGS